MKTFRRLLTSLALVLLILGGPIVFAPDAKADTCVDGVACVGALPAVTVTVPGPVRTIVKRVTVPGPVSTVTQRVTVPGPRTTVTKIQTRTIPGPVSTVTLVKPAPNKTVVVRSGQTTTIGQPPPSSGSMATATATVTATRTVERPVDREKTVRITAPQAAGLSAGILLLGGIVGALLLLWAYRSGYVESDNKNLEELEDLRDDTK